MTVRAGFVLLFWNRNFRSKKEFCIISLSIFVVTKIKRNRIFIYNNRNYIRRKEVTGSQTLKNRNIVWLNFIVQIGRPKTKKKYKQHRPFLMNATEKWSYPLIFRRLFNCAIVLGLLRKNSWLKCQKKFERGKNSTKRGHYRTVSGPCWLLKRLKILIRVWCWNICILVWHWANMTLTGTNLHPFMTHFLKLSFSQLPPIRILSGSVFFTSYMVVNLLFPFQAFICVSRLYFLLWPCR